MKDAPAPAPLDGETFRGRCAGCDHVWVVAYLPQPLDAVAQLAMKAACPRGCSAKVLVG